MREQQYISILKTHIENKFGNGGADNWINSDFVRLSEEITKNTKIYLSPTSLKRIFGKVSYNSRPQKNTLNALAQYAGYGDWYQFIEETDKLSDDNTKEKWYRTIPQKSIIISVSAIIVISLIWLTFSVFPSHPDFEFSYKGESSGAPYNAVIHYDISKVKSKNCYAMFSDHFVRD